MKTPIMVGLISSLFLGGSITFQGFSSLNNKQESKLEKFSNKSSENFLSSMSCYVDGDEKVFLNDLGNANIVFDSWNYNETKTININANLMGLDSKSKFLEIEIPKGLKLMSTPESLVNNTLIDLDDSQFKLNNYNIETGDASKNIYTSNNGILRYKINPGVTGINLDILLAVDNILWDSRSSLATPGDEDKIKITIGDKNNSKTLKLDKINVNNVNYKPWYWSGTENNYLTQDLEKKYSETILFSNEVRLFKNLEVEMEKPFIEKNINGIITKEYLPIKNISAGKKGTYLETTNSVIFSWSNVYADRVDMSFTLNVSKNIANNGDIVKIIYKGGKFRGILSNQEHVITQSKTITSTVVSNEEEHIVFSGEAHGAYKSGEESDILYSFGRLNLKNEGAPSNRKRLSIEFPIGDVGIKTIRLPAPKEARNYTLNLTLWDRGTNELYETTVVIKKGVTSQEYHGYLLTVTDAVNLSELQINNVKNIYFKSIEYDIGVLPSKYSSGPLEPWHTSDSGNSYGEVFSTAKEIDYKIKYVLTDLDDSDIEPVVTYSSTPVRSNTNVTIRINNFKLLNGNNQTTSQIMAGESIALKGNLYSPSYAYNHSSHIKNPEFYLKIPKQIKIDEDNSYFEYISSGTRERIDFSIVNKNNPVATSDNMVAYKIKLNMNNKAIGYYKENLGEIGNLDFNIVLKTPKSLRSTTLNIGETMFIGDEFLKTNGSSDKWDVDGDGNTNETFVNTENLPLSIISNTIWLDVDYSTDDSTSTGNKEYRPISSIEDIISCKLLVNNTNEGYVRAGNMEYYIPIPKKDIDYNEYIKDSGETFNFDMILVEKVSPIEGFDIFYTYNNVDYFEFFDDLDLSKVSMVKFVNNRDFAPDETVDFGVNIKYLENSWDSTENDVVWSIYGHQIYEKNGMESSFLHVLDKLKVELLFPPEITENPLNKTVEAGEDVLFSVDLNMGIPYATGNWQYKSSSDSSWVDLPSETSLDLILKSVNIDKNGAQYRYVATNKAGRVESKPATLIVVDDEGPIITLNEFKDGDVYKITITAIDNGSGISHIILPDGTRVDSNTYTMIADVNTEYIFKAYDLAGNESIKSTIIETLVPKNVSSNLDVYIKSKNMLSLSIDSNNITFENYSGVEDIEKLNAVNITVSSSLPYEIKAYLPSNIQNADKSETLDKSVLNIKASGDTEYRPFNNDSNPILLLENQVRGNGIVHSLDLKLKGNTAHKADVYKTTIKIEVNQK